MKTCSACLTTKTLDFFYRHKKYKDGHTTKCKDCIKIDLKKYYEANREKLIKKSIEYRDSNYEKFLENCRNRYDPKKAKKRREIYKPRRNEITKFRKQTDIEFRLSCNIRSRLNQAIKNKSDSTLSITGCSFLDLKSYLESKFQEGMSWKNYGRTGWHIDHIKPLAKFNLQDPKQLKEACHYSNLQPLWAKDNISKRDKWIDK